MPLLSLSLLSGDHRLQTPCLGEKSGRLLLHYCSVEHSTTTEREREGYMEEGGRKWEERSSIIKGISKIAATTPASLEAKGRAGGRTGAKVPLAQLAHSIVRCIKKATVY